MQESANKLSRPIRWDAPPPWMHILGRRVASFRVFGILAVVAGSLQSFVLAYRIHRSLTAILCLEAAAISAVFAATMARKILTGRETLSGYQTEFIALAASAIYLRSAGDPIRPYLDLAALGIGAFIAFAKLGCLAAGCCHGRPCRAGIRYAGRHVRAGFSPYLAGVSLFPIQAAESALAFSAVLLGIAEVIAGLPAGTALESYVLLFSLGRFFLEFGRGDRERVYFCGFSQTQWTSLVVIASTACAERLGYLPVSPWPDLLAIALAALMAGLLLWRRIDPAKSYELSNSAHLWEILTALNHLARPLDRKAQSGHEMPHTIHVAQTSAGYRVSVGESITLESEVNHRTVSKVDGSLTRRGATRIAQLILSLQPQSKLLAVVDRGSGVFHIVLSRHEDLNIGVFSRSNPGETLLPGEALR